MTSVTSTLSSLVLFLILAGCAAFSGETEINLTPVASDRRPPERILTAFLAAWDADPADSALTPDYDEMHSLIAPPSRALYPRDDFEARYEEIADDLGLQGIRYELGETTMQGTAASILYDLTFQTVGFGEITDARRIARFIQVAGEGWRLAWSTQDILSGLAGNANVQLLSTREERANIYDYRGRPLVEEGGLVTTIYVAKNDMSSEVDCAATLARVTRRSVAAIEQLFIGWAPETYFYVGEIDPDFWDPALQNHCGAGNNGYTHTLPKRAYYGHGAATHITGYIGPVTADRLAYWEARGITASAIVGRDGIEYYYDDVLGGAPQRELRIVEPGGTVLRELDSSVGRPVAPLTLTIDRDLQRITAQAIADAYNAATNHWGSVALGAAAVALDVRSGAIRASVSWPSFDPGIFNRAESNAPQRFVTDLTTSTRQPTIDRTFRQVAPGSVYKIVTTAAIAEEELIPADFIFDCGHNWDGSAYGDTVGTRYDWTYSDGIPPTGPVTIRQALASSCDPFFYEYGAQLYNKGENLLVDYAERFGLGSRTGFDERFATAENTGNNAPPAVIEAAINNAIGQGDVQTTPLQMARAVAAIANGGSLVQPYLVERIGGVDGAALTYEYARPEPTSLGLRESTLEIVQQGMCDVVRDGNLGTAARVFDDLRSYTLCGKTGTAESAGAPYAWFVAYAPAENAELAWVVMVENSHEGSIVAAPILRRILDDYYGAPRGDWPEIWEEEYTAPTIGPGGTGA
ncbi:MAG: penicillin-binding transpeptidase domain-containing protein [Chloroflexi bacterium]|nr:penicillin-binding transpeptidase domain-containing protein [Chloroflexota bacterium]